MHDGGNGVVSFDFVHFPWITTYWLPWKRNQAYWHNITDMVESRMRLSNSGMNYSIQWTYCKCRHFYSNSHHPSHACVLIKKISCCQVWLWLDFVPDLWFRLSYLTYDLDFRTWLMICSYWTCMKYLPLDIKQPTIAIKS